MDESKARAQRFVGYPKPVEGPRVTYHKSKDENPVVRGTILVIGAWLVSKLEFVQKFLWANAGFDCLRKLDLRDCNERWDPTVIPIHLERSISAPPKLDSESFPMLPDHLPGRYRSIAEYHALYLSGQLTPLAVVESLLPLIRRDIEPRSHHSTAFISCNSDAIIQAARESSARYAAGTPLSIFDGVPTAIKDECKVAGYRTTTGRKPNDALFEIESESAWPVQKWEEAGGIILGKLNMHEVGADTTNNNPNWGTPRNPYNSQYYTGGSSGGAAYAVSAGLVPVALGSDGGGSIRIPSSFCGIYGLKPTHGRLEDTGSTVTVTGPLAASISDLSAVYRLMANPNPSDPVCTLFTPPHASPEFISYPKIIGICKVWFERADPAVLEICNKTIEYYQKKLGHEIVDIDLPYLPEGQTAHAITILSEMAASARAKPASVKNWLSGFTPANKVLLAVGSQTPARDYLLAQQLRNMYMQHLAFLYQKYPGLIIVTPTSPMPCWPIDQEGDLKYGVTDGNKSIRNMEYVWLANFCGNPAISCPVGYVAPEIGKGEGRMPIGIMAMGEWGAEDQLLEWGREAEGWLNEGYEGGRVRAAGWIDLVEEARGKMGVA